MIYGEMRLYYFPQPYQIESNRRPDRLEPDQRAKAKEGNGKKMK